MVADEVFNSMCDLQNGVILLSPQVRINIFIFILSFRVPSLFYLTLNNENNGEVQRYHRITPRM